MSGQLGAVDWSAVLGGVLSNIGTQVSHDAAAKAGSDAKAAGATDAEARLKAATEGRRAAEKTLRTVSADIQSKTGGYPPVVYVGGGLLALTTAGLVYALARK